MQPYSCLEAQMYVTSTTGGGWAVGKCGFDHCCTWPVWPDGYIIIQCMGNNDNLPKSIRNAKVGTKVYQIQNKASKNLPKNVYFFCQSGEILPNLVTLYLTHPNSLLGWTNLEEIILIFSAQNRSLPRWLVFWSWTIKCVLNLAPPSSITWAIS